MRTIIVHRRQEHVQARSVASGMGLMAFEFSSIAWRFLGEHGYATAHARWV
jgi:hypothetical protein